VSAGIELCNNSKHEQGEKREVVLNYDSWTNRNINPEVIQSLDRGCEHAVNI
jgi:hypothetical protein